MLRAYFRQAANLRGRKGGGISSFIQQDQPAIFINALEHPGTDIAIEIQFNFARALP
jgi:hypothetical protein